MKKCFITSRPDHSSHLYRVTETHCWLNGLGLFHRRLMLQGLVGSLSLTAFDAVFQSISGVIQKEGGRGEKR